MKLQEFMNAIKAAGLHSLYSELVGIIDDAKEKHGIKGDWRREFNQGLLRHLNIEGVFRNGLDVSLEAHATVESQRFRSRCSGPVELARVTDGEGEG